MKEIKFRAWDKKNKEMFDVYQIQLLKSGISIKKMSDIHDGIKRNCVLMQYTGLKDRNGKEIYEGDIVINYNTKTGHKRYSHPIIIKFEKTRHGYGYPIGTPEAYEIVGNIYENRELIK